MRYLLTLLVVTWIPAIASAQSVEGQQPTKLPPIVPASATVAESTYPYPWNQDEAPAEKPATPAIATETVDEGIVYDEGDCCAEDCCGVRGRLRGHFCGGIHCCWDWCEEPIMESHMWYIADPKTYYYFRPYNYAHIFMQQHEAQQMGINPKNPYSNSIFNDVYARLKKEDEAAQAGN